MEQYECCNKHRVYVSKEEHKEHKREYDREHREERRANDRKYYKQNRERNNQRCREYREQNRERLNQQKRERVECECGAMVCRNSLQRHRKSKKHLKLISN